MLTSGETSTILELIDMMEQQGRKELRDALFDMAGRLAQLSQSTTQAVEIAKAACAHLVATGPCDEMDVYDSSCTGCADSECTYCCLARSASGWRVPEHEGKVT